jgi:tetratricopeptide (TPR) repeat protein
VATVVAAVSLVVFLVGTFQRNLVWRTNLSLYRDTAAKNPDDREPRGQYGIALYKTGDINGAERELAIARTLYSFEYFERFDINYSVVLARLGRYEEAVAVCEKVLVRTKGKSVHALQNLIEFRSVLLKRAREEKTERRIMEKIIENAESFAKLATDPYDLYYTGKIALALDDRPVAIMLFTKARNGFGVNDPYRHIAERMLSRLGLRKV